MECSQTFTDEELEPWMSVLAPSSESVHSIRSMPDLCPMVLHVGLWHKTKAEDEDVPEDSQQYWSKMLTGALPNPCKGRSISDRLSEDMLTDMDVYDCVLRVLFGTFLGVYEGNYQAPFDVRIMCYSAFALHPPTPAQLSQFVRTRKTVTTFCFRAYLLFLMKQTVMHDVLCSRYEWKKITTIIEEGMDQFRRSLSSVAYGPGFLTDNYEWNDIDAYLCDVNKTYKKHVFRASTEPFYKRALRDMKDIQRLEIKAKNPKSNARVTSLPVPRLCLEDVLYCLYFEKDSAVPKGNVHRLTDIRDWGGLRDFPEIEEEYEKARDLYEREVRMTGAQRLLYGTKTRPFGLFVSNRYAYERLRDFMHACDVRLRVRWGVLPQEWMDLQQAALRKRIGMDVLPYDASLYFFCPQCGSIRSFPAEWPMGNTTGVRNQAYYSKQIRLDLYTMEHCCATKMNKRRKGAIMRRRTRNAKKTKKPLKHATGDDIQVCDGTFVVPVSMAGLLLSTEADGVLLLCVYCACLLHYTPACMTAKGPSCGCNLPPQENDKEPEKKKTETCAICKKKISPSRSRSHVLLGEDGIVDVRVCRSHYTRYANTPDFMFTLDMLQTAVRRNLRVRMVNGAPFFHKRIKAKKKRRLLN